MDEIKGILFSKIINLGASSQPTPEPHCNSAGAQSYEVSKAQLGLPPEQELAVQLCKETKSNLFTQPT